MARISTAYGLNAAHSAYVETRGRASSQPAWWLRFRRWRLRDQSDDASLAARKAIREELDWRAR